MASALERLQAILEGKSTSTYTVTAPTTTTTANQLAPSGTTARRLQDILLKNGTSLGGSAAPNPGEQKQNIYTAPKAVPVNGKSGDVWSWAKIDSATPQVMVDANFALAQQAQGKAVAGIPQQFGNHVENYQVAQQREQAEQDMKERPWAFALAQQAQGKAVAGIPQQFGNHVANSQNYNVEADRQKIAELTAATSNLVPTQDKYGRWQTPDTTAEREELAALQQKVYQYDQGKTLAEYQRTMDNPMFALVAEFGKQNNPIEVMGPGGFSQDAAKQAVDVGNMTETEKDVYYYLMGSDQKRASEYMEALRETLNQRQGQRVSDAVTNIQNPAARALVTGVGGFGMGVDQFGGGVKQLFTNERLPTSTEQFASQGIREGLDGVGPDIFGASLGQVLYDATTVAGNMAPSILAGSITGGLGAAPAVSGAVGSATLGLSAGGNAYNEMKAKGYTDAQARSYGTLTAASEAGLQYLLGGVGALSGGGSGLTELAKGIEKAWLRVPAQLVLNMAKEGGEEALQEVLSPVLESIATGAKYSPANIEDIAYAGIMGALMGAVGGEYKKADVAVNANGVVAPAVGDVANVAGAVPYDGGIGTGDPSPTVGETSAVESVAGAPVDLASLGIETGKKRRGAKKFKGGMEIENNTPLPMTEEPSWDSEEVVTNVPETMSAVRQAIVDVADGKSLTGNQVRELLANPEAVADMQADGLVLPGEGSKRRATVSAYVQQKAQELVTERDNATIKAIQDLRAEIEGTALDVQSVGENIETSAPNMQSIDETIETNIENKPTLQQNETKEPGLLRDSYVEENIPGETAGVIDQTAKLLGLRVAFADSVAEGKANAQISGDEILIERGNKNPVTFLYGHEVTHRMQEAAPAEYQALKDVLAPRLAEEAKTLEFLYRGNGLDMSTDKAMDEAVANEVGRLMEGGTALEEFIQRNSQNKPLLRRFLDAVRSLVGKLTGKSKRSVQTVEARLARALDASVAQDNDMDTAWDWETSYSLKNNDESTTTQSDSDGNALSSAQQEYFKGSKVRDENGNLLVVYHGSRSAFTEFSHSFIGLNGKAEGSGFYFTNDKSMAEGYYGDGGQLLKGYLNIAKPLSQNEITLSRAKVKKLIQTLDPTGDELLSSYDSSGIGYPSRSWYQKALNEALDMIVDSSDSDGDIIAEISNVIGDTKGVLSAVNKLYGYDGYIVKGKYDGTVCVAFQSNQFKNADNMSPTEDSDIRYSAKGSEDAKAMADLEKENKLLRERVERWRGQLKKTDGITLQEGAVYKVARELAKEFDADVDVEQLSKDLYALYNGIAHGIHAHGLDAKNGLDLDAIQQTANDIGATLAESSMVDDVSYYEEYKDVRDYFRTQPLRISAEDRAGIADYGDFRKRNFGRMKLQTGPTNIDQVYKEMSEQRPELFDETVETNVEDQLLRISEVLDNIYRKNTVNPYGGFLDAAAVDMGNEILNRYFDIPVVKRTFADVQQGKLDKQKELNRAKIQELRAKNRESTAKIRAKDKAVYKEQMAKEIAKRKVAVEKAVSEGKVEANRQANEAKLVGQITQGKTMAEKARKQQEKADAKLTKTKEDANARLEKAQAKADQKLEKTVAKADEKLAKTKAKADETLEKTKARADAKLEKSQERLAVYRDSQKKRELRATILRGISPLRSRLLNPTDKAHIPDSMRGAVAEVLQAVNLGSKFEYVYGKDGKYKKVPVGSTIGAEPTSLTKSFQNLKNQYIQAANNAEISRDDFLIGEDGVNGLFDDVIAMGDIALTEMTQKQLETVKQALQILQHLVMTSNKMFAQSKYATIADISNKIKRDTATRRTKRSLTKAHVLLDMENPYTFFRHYGEAGADIYRMLRNAQDLQTTRLERIIDLTQKIVDPATVKRLESERFTFTTNAGEDLTLTKAQVMDLYLLNNRQQAQGHILGQGVYQPEIKGSKIRRANEATKLTMEDLSSLLENLTVEEKMIASKLQKLSTGPLATWGNEASMEVFGYKKFMDKEYWAIHSARENLQQTVEKGKNKARSIKNAGMAKNTVKNANNPVDIYSVFANFSQQASDMLDYSVWLAPMESTNRIFNYKFKDENGVVTSQTMQGLLDEKGGAGAAQYWLNLEEDIQNGIGDKKDSALGSIAAKLTGAMKGAAVGANLSVIVQQPTAFLRARMVLAATDMAAGLASSPTKGKGWEKALKYAPIASRKAAGGFDIRSAYNVSDRIFDQRTALQKFNEKMGAGAALMDNVTWGKIWNACEWNVSKNRTGLEVGSPEYYKAVSEKFTDVIDQTQVVDGVLQRSQVMRSSSALVKQMTAFMGEPTMSYNMAVRAYDQYSNEQDASKRKPLLKNFGRAVSSVMIASTFNALVVSMVAGYRDDDKEKGYWEKVLSAFTGLDGSEESTFDAIWNAVIGGNFANALNPLNNIPFVKDAMSLLQGYTVERMDISTIADFFDAASSFIGNAGGNGTKTQTYALKQLATATAKVFGVSAVNILRDVWALARTVAYESDNMPLSYEMEKAIYNLSNSSNKGGYYDLMFKALSIGDFESYDMIRDDLVETMPDVTGKTITSAMQSRYKKEAKSNSEVLSQDALDKINVVPDYYQTASADTFGQEDLTAKENAKFETLRSSTYVEIEDDFIGYGIMSGISDKEKDTLVSSASNYAEYWALYEASGGKAELDSTWMNWAHTAEEYGIESAEAILFKLAADTSVSEKDKDGKTIGGSKKENTLETATAWMPWLTDEQLYYLMAKDWTPESQKLKDLKDAGFIFE